LSLCWYRSSSRRSSARGETDGFHVLPVVFNLPGKMRERDPCFCVCVKLICRFLIPTTMSVVSRTCYWENKAFDPYARACLARVLKLPRHARRNSAHALVRKASEHHVPSSHNHTAPPRPSSYTGRSEARCLLPPCMPDRKRASGPWCSRPIRRDLTCASGK
jgi:hypothetical protein